MSITPAEFWKSRQSLPAYRVGEAAIYTHMSPQTVAAWQRRSVTGKSIILSDREPREGLSFLQLIELAVVAEMRKSGLDLKKIGSAREYFVKTTGLRYPFAQLKFKTDGAEILCDDDTPLVGDDVKRMISADSGGQYVWRTFLAERLKEFNYDDSGAVAAWRVAGADRHILIDPRVAFGAPQVWGVKTRVIKSRWISGDEVHELAEDFELKESDVVEALLFEGLDRENPRLSKWIN